MLDAIIRTASRMPLAGLHALARGVAPLARLGYRPRLVAANLARALPEADAKVLAKAFYGGFAATCVEVVRALSMSREELLARVGCHGEEVLRDGNALLLMGHHANMIWAVLALASRIPAPVSIVYKPPHAPSMRDLLIALAARYGVDLVPVNAVRRQLVKKDAQQGRVWTLVADQRPGKDRHHAELFGRPTPFFLGPERIARAFDWPVYYLSCQRVAAGRYQCRVLPVATPPHGAPGRVIERYAQLLQADIDHAPADWLWSHDRWR